MKTRAIRRRKKEEDRKLDQERGIQTASRSRIQKFTVKDIEGSRKYIVSISKKLKGGTTVGEDNKKTKRGGKDLRSSQGRKKKI